MGRLWVEIDADIIEASKARAADILHPVVGNQELLFPPHEDSSSVGVFHGEVRLLELIADVPERRETAPMDHVFLLRRAPVPSQEAIPTANDLCVKVRGEFRPVICQSAYAEVSTEVGERKVDVHNGHADIVAVPAALLCALENSTGI